MTDKDQWQTPPYILEAARAALGGDIDLDPATSPEAQKRVRADRWWTLADDALSRDWRSPSVWCNPPYSGPGPFVGKMVKGWQSGDVRSGLIILTATAAFGSIYGRPLLAACRLIYLPGSDPASGRNAPRVEFIDPGPGQRASPPGASVILAGGSYLDIETAARALEELGPVLAR